MPEHDPPQSPEREPEQLLADVRIVVRQVCKKLSCFSDQDAVEGIVSRVIETLYDKDAKVLHSFKRRSRRRTWLYPIVKSIILQRIESQKRMVALEDALLESLIVQPDQEERLISEEEEKKKKTILFAALGKLTFRERKLFSLMRQGFKDDEITHEMRMKKKSVYTEKSTLKKKLREIIKASMDSPDDGIKDKG